MRDKDGTMNMKTIWLCAVCAVGLWVALGAPRDNLPLVDHVVPPRAAIDLGSTNAWEFALVRTGTKWDDPAIKWKTVPIPSNHPCPFWEKPPKPNEVYCRRTFDLTAAEAARGAVLRFELVSVWCEVIVNGKLVYLNRDPSAPFSCDVTGALRPGRNTLALRVFSPKRDGKDWPVIPGWAESVYFGVSRPLHLELMDKVSIADAFIVTKVVPEKVWTAQVTVTNRTAQAVEVEVKVDCHASLSDARNDETTLPVIARSKATKQSIPPRGSKVVELSFPWKEARLWSPADPHLYYARFELCGRLGEATLPKGLADGRVGSPSRPTALLDAYCQRFGFRELGIRGNRLTLNGFPYMNRRDSVSLGNTVNNKLNVSTERMHETIARLKARGIVGARVGSQLLAREARVADETGFLLSVLPPTGAAYTRHDVYFVNVSNLVRNVVTRFRNHPSIIYWGLFNEFGQFYGLGNAEVQTPKTVEAGKFAMSLDPTRFYCSHGDAEMGVPATGPGPCPVRSLHYPQNLNYGGNDFPEVAYWYAEGRRSWQGVSPRDKPLLISEDLYHGMNDVPRAMAKWQDDDIYEAEGYFAAWRKALLMMADGYYYGGVSEWNPWYLNATAAKNPLCDGAQFMPDFLVARRHAFANVSSGEEFSDSLHVYNQTFAPVTATLTRRDTFGDKEVKTTSETFTLQPGERRDGTLDFRAPQANDAPGLYRVAFTLAAGGKTLATRAYDFNVLPKPDAFKMPRRAILIDYGIQGTSSPVRVQFKAKHVFTNATVLAKLKSDVTLLVTGAVPTDEAKALNAWVDKGGRAVFLANLETTWSPVPCDKRQTHAYAWRRNAKFLSDLPNTVWQVWRPDANLSRVVLEKDPMLDLDVLLDSFHSGGRALADAVRLPRAKGGSWLVTSLPIESSYGVEPAAAYLLTRLLHEQAKPHDTPRVRGYAFLGGAHPYEIAFAQQGFAKPVLKARKGEISPVLLADASVPLDAAAQAKILAYAKKGGTVILTETSTTNRAFLARLGLGMRARGAMFYYKPTGGGHIMTPYGKHRSWRREDDREALKGATPWTAATRAAIEEKLDNQGEVTIFGDCPENQPFIDRALVAWREANRDWFTRVGMPMELAGLSNGDFFFSKALIENVFRWEGSRTSEFPRLGLYTDVQDVSYGILLARGETREETVGEPVWLLKPHVFAKVPVGKGVVYVMTLKTDDIRGKYPQRFARLWRQLLGNLAVRTATASEILRLSPTEVQGKVRLWANPETKDSAPVLFGDGDDLRYFPVNQCGWSLSANNRCPVEPFPQEAIVLGGLRFKLAVPNPKKGDASVALANTTLFPPRGKERVKRAWVLAALDKPPSDPQVLSGEKPILFSLWFAEGKGWNQGAKPSAYYGKDIGAWRAPIVPTGKGRVAWEGFSGKGKKAALYAFPLENAYGAGAPVKMMNLNKSCKDVELAIFAVAWETE